MDFISSIWKTTSKPEPKVPEADAPDVLSKPVDEEPKETVIPPKEASAGSDSGSTSGPDSEAPPSPETPNPDVQNEDKASVGTSISVPLENVSQKALESAKSLGSFLFSVANKAGKTVQETAKQIKTTVEENSILADFNREQESFAKTKQRCDIGILPWVGCEDEENVKQQVLSLSADKRNFVRSPPSGVQFEFDMDTMSPVAMALLQEDSNLEKMRFEIVPKLIPESDFWRNYFYRVSLIKQSTQLSALGGHNKGSSSSGDSSCASSRQSPSDDSNKQHGPMSPDDEENALDSPTHEFVSDTYQGNNISVEEVKMGMKQLGMGDKAADDEWEKELQQELQDYEVVATDAAAHADDPEWENEIQEMLASDK
ncbi:synapse-associated protein 1 isoform X1 [Ixodes scapularis]|uniref:synapse-associated protein 1 isoform X1 n=1 Tax=Ixodes scapularis TaxID=6945 RepID=UPI001A9E8AB7|nr:synapse-associated protein 1 isoform X1 [Ixodes scapularis]